MTRDINRWPLPRARKWVAARWPVRHQRCNPGRIDGWPLSLPLSLPPGPSSGHARATSAGANGETSGPGSELWGRFPNLPVKKSCCSSRYRKYRRAGRLENLPHVKYGSIAVIERLIGTIKRNGLAGGVIPFRCEALRQLRYSVIGWYNEHRLHPHRTRWTSTGDLAVGCVRIRRCVAQTRINGPVPFFRLQIRSHHVWPAAPLVPWVIFR